MVFNDDIIPILSKDILKEYNAVLRRKKFGFPEESVSAFLQEITQKSVLVTPTG